MTTFVYGFNVVAYDKPTGNRLAAIVGTDVGDAHTFDNAGKPCYPAGTTFTTSTVGPNTIRTPSAAPVAWAVYVPAEQAAYDTASTYQAGGYPAALIAAGMTNAQIDAVRSVVKVQAGSRSAIEGTLAEFVSSLGLVM